MIDAVLFDFGGVFIPSPFAMLPTLEPDERAVLEREMTWVFGSYDTDSDHPWHRLERGEVAFTDALAEIVSLAAAEGHELDPWGVLRRFGIEATVREEVVAVVREVRDRGLQTAILTNNFHEVRDRWQAMLPVAELFDLIVDSSEVGMRKPDPRIFRHTLELLGIDDPTRAVFLDDVAGNVDGARSIGVHGILVEAEPAPALDELRALLG